MKTSLPSTGRLPVAPYAHNLSPIFDSTKNLQYFHTFLHRKASRHQYLRLPHLNFAMSSQGDQQAIWTPPVIATIVYRVVMIIVSIAFLWKKYRRPARHLDGELASRNIQPGDRNLTVPQRRTTRRRPSATLQYSCPPYPPYCHSNTSRGHLGPSRGHGTISYRI
jgi:hypothetical protein